MSIGDEQPRLLAFLLGEFVRVGMQQCVRVELFHAPGRGYSDESLRSWERADHAGHFEISIAGNVEQFAAEILENAERDVNSRPAGKYRYVVRATQHQRARQTHSFSLQPAFTGNDDMTALATTGGGGDTLIAQHAAQLMRTNSQMFDGTIRVLGSTNENLRIENTELRVENIALRRDNEELRSNRTDHDFQIAMAAEKNARTNAGFQKLMQIGTVVAAKIASGAGAPELGGPSPLAMLVADFGKSLRQDQIAVLMQTLDGGQKLMFMEIMGAVQNQEAPAEAPQAPPPSSPPPTNGAPSP